MNREDRQILWSALMAGLLTGGLVCAVWLFLQIAQTIDLSIVP